MVVGGWHSAGHREAPTNGSDCVHVFGGPGREGHCQQEEPIAVVRAVVEEVSTEGGEQRRRTDLSGLPVNGSS